MRYLAALVLLVFISSSNNFCAKAQFPGIQWDKSFGYGFGSEYSSMTLISDGNYLVGGTISANCQNTGGHGHGITEFWIAKISPNGNKIWENHFGGLSVESLENMTQTSDGGFILGGWSASGISGEKSQSNKGIHNYWIVKVDSLGNKEWDKTFGGHNTDYLSTVIQTNDGGFLLGGSSTSLSNADKSLDSDPSGDFWIIRTDSLGNKLWEKTIQEFSINKLQTMTQTSDGGFLVGGYTMSHIGLWQQPAQGGSDYILHKLNAAGNIVWNKRFGGIGDDYLESIIQTNDGGYILGGYSDSGISGNKTQASQGYYDYWVIKLSATGTLQWDKTFGGNDSDKLYAVIQTSDGGYLLAGNSLSGISGDKSEISRGFEDYWIIKLNAAGAKLWDKTIGGDGVDILTSANEISPNQFLLGGSSTSEISGEKTDSNFGGDRRFWLVKTGVNITGINEINGNPAFSVFPNPNNGNFTIELKEVLSKTATLTLTDLAGREILKQTIPVVDNKISKVIPTTDYKGVYILHLKAGDRLYTQKLICN